LNPKQLSGSNSFPTGSIRSLSLTFPEGT